MGLLARKTGDDLMVVGIIRDFFGYKALDSIASIRAADNEGWQGSNCCIVRLLKSAFVYALRWSWETHA